MPTFGGWVVAFCVFLFGYTTLIGWAYYGEQFFEYILGRNVTVPYRWIYCLLIPFGAVTKVDLVWAWGDLMNALQVFPNLIGLIGLSGLVAGCARARPRRAAVPAGADPQPGTPSPLDRRPAPVGSLRNSHGQAEVWTGPSLRQWSHTLPAVAGDKDRSLQEAVGRLLALSRPGGLRQRPDCHHDPASACGPAVVSRSFPQRPTSGCEGARRAGIQQLYTHQAAAFAHVLAGRNVVTITPTASGKTLCYNAPVLDAILKDPSTRALYLFPTKALAQDQLAELHNLVSWPSEHGAPRSACSPTTATRRPTPAARSAARRTSC